MKRARTKKARATTRRKQEAKDAAMGAFAAYHAKFVQPLIAAHDKRLKLVEDVLKRSLEAAIGDAEVVVVPECDECSSGRGLCPAHSVTFAEEEPLELYDPGCIVCNPAPGPEGAEPGNLCARHAGVVTIVKNEEAL